MIRYFCDLCEKETDGTKLYHIPIKKRDYGFMIVPVHLCGDCCNEFNILVHKLATINMTEKLDEVVNNEEDY